jgi:hypothetical protein
MRVLHWKWTAILVIPMFVTILWASVYHRIGDHAILLGGVTRGGNATTTTTTTTTSSSSSSSSSSR